MTHSIWPSFVGSAVSISLSQIKVRIQAKLPYKMGSELPMSGLEGLDLIL